MNSAMLNAIGKKITVAGTVYTLCPLRAIEYAEIESRIISQRRNPIEAIVPLLKSLDRDDPLREQYAEKAYTDSLTAKIVTIGELEDWRGSLPGVYFEFYLQIRQMHSDIDETASRAICDQFGRDYVDECCQELKRHSPGLSDVEAVRVILGAEPDRGLRELVDKLSGMPEPDPTPPPSAGEET